MDIEKLIETVRKYLVLYDLSHPKYMDSKYKNYVWNNVGAELGIEGSVCKTRWTNLRDTYRKSLKRSVIKSGNSGKRVKIYKFHQQLEFLRPFLNERQTVDNIDTDISDELESGQTDRQSEINIASNESDQSTLSAAQQESALTFQPRPSTCRSLSPSGTTYQSSLSSKNSKRSRRVCTSRSYSQPTSATATVVMEHLAAAPNASSETSFNNPIDAFLLGALSPILKSLPPYELALAKKELFEIAQKYEFKMANIIIPIVISKSED